MPNALVNGITLDVGSPQGPDWPQRPARAALNTRSTTIAGRTSQGKPVPETARSTPLPQEDTMRKLIIWPGISRRIGACALTHVGLPVFLNGMRSDLARETRTG